MCHIGLLTYKKHPLEQVPPFRLRALLAESVLQEAQLLLLDSRNYNLQKERITASVWHDGGWQQEQRPLPDIVIIIGSPLTPEQEQLDQWVCSQRLVICDIGANKLKTSQLLENTDYQHFLIPWSEVPKENIEQFMLDFISRHNGVVVKMANANQGVGLNFLYQEPESQNWILKNDRSNISGSLEDSVAMLVKRVSGRIHYRDYIAQKYIQSSTSDGRIFDLRVHVQRQDTEQWVVTRGYVRLAEENSPLPNTSKGGYQGDLLPFLMRRDKHVAELLLQKVYSAAIDITIEFDKTRALPLSEAGIDFILDGDNKIWLVEVNTLPQSARHEHERAIHTIAYAKQICTHGYQKR